MIRKSNREIDLSIKFIQSAINLGLFRYDLFYFLTLSFERSLREPYSFGYIRLSDVFIKDSLFKILNHEFFFVTKLIIQSEIKYRRAGQKIYILTLLRASGIFLKFPKAENGPFGVKLLYLEIFGVKLQYFGIPMNSYKITVI